MMFNVPSNEHTPCYSTDLYREIIAVFEILIEHENVLCGQM
jgi:hypothetical protein